MTDTILMTIEITGLILLILIALKIWNRDGIDVNQYLADTRTVSDNYSRVNEVISNLEIELVEARKDNLNIQNFGRDLSDVLKRPVIRGKVGEKLLEEMCGEYLPEHRWKPQEVTDEDAKSKSGGVDVLIKYSNVNLPVDSKFPREAWRRYINLSGESMSGMTEVEIDSHNDEIKSQWKKFIQSIKAKVGEIEKHINPPNTTDFALMFIPSEAMYYSTISDKNAINQHNELLEYMLSKRVIPVSPSLFYAFIEVIKIGLANLAIIDNMEEMRKEISRFKSKTGTWSSAHSKAGQKIKEASDEWDTANARFTELQKKANDIVAALDKVHVDEEGASSTKELVAESETTSENTEEESEDIPAANEKSVVTQIGETDISEESGDAEDFMTDETTDSEDSTT
jgi:DNA recombination protein RmuC